MTRILFVCIGNSARSQMAEAYCRELGSGVECSSAGSEPAPNVQHNAVAVMGEVGMDISQARPRGFDAVLPGAWDYVVTMGCDVECPFVPGAKTVSWDIPDPRGRPLAEFRRVRDMIKIEVEKLLEQIAGAASETRPT